MARPTTSRTPPARQLDVIPGGRLDKDRDSLLRRAREARRHLQPRHERFAHLKRQYD